MRNIKAELVKETNVFGVKLVNLTPHDITIFTKDSDRALVTLKSSGKVARVKTKEVEIGDINGIPVTETTFGEIENVPEERDDTIFIVSALVLSANASSSNPRTDLVAPNTAPSGAVRDENGNIIGVRGFTIR